MRHKAQLCAHRTHSWRISCRKTLSFFACLMDRSDIFCASLVPRQHFQFLIVDWVKFAEYYSLGWTASWVFPAFFPKMASPAIHGALLRIRDGFLVFSLLKTCCRYILRMLCWEFHKRDTSAICWFCESRTSRCTFGLKCQPRLLFGYKIEPCGVFRCLRWLYLLHRSLIKDE